MKSFLCNYGKAQHMYLNLFQSCLSHHKLAKCLNKNVDFRNYIKFIGTELFHLVVLVCAVVPTWIYRRFYHVKSKNQYRSATNCPEPNRPKIWSCRAVNRASLCCTSLVHKRGAASWLCGWPCTGTHFPERWWNLPQGRYSRPIWMYYCSVSSRMTLLEQQDWSRWPTVGPFQTDSSWGLVSGRADGVLQQQLLVPTGCVGMAI